MRKRIFYPGNQGQPCLCQYDIAYAPTPDSHPGQQQVWVMFFDLPRRENRGGAFPDLPPHCPSFLMTKVAEQELPSPGDDTQLPARG